MWSQLKLLAHKDIIKNIVENEVSMPTHIQIELTENCNYSCVFCPWHGEKKGAYKNLDFVGKRFFDIDRLLTLIDELKECGVKAISITGAGENILHPKFDIFIEKLSNSGIDFALTSNFGLQLQDSVLKNLLKAKWLRWSVNAYNEETYNNINRPKHKNAFFVSQNNIKRLVELRTDEKVHIGSSFVIGDYNKNDILEIAKFIKTLNIDSLSYRPDTPLLRNDKIYQYDKQTINLLERSCELSNNKFKVYANVQRLEDNLLVTDDTLKCYYSNHSIHIISNGDVYPCCMTRYDKKYKYGNIMDKSFKEFWLDINRINNYNNIFMKDCPSCHHTTINKVLKYMYESNTMDNFI